MSKEPVKARKISKATLARMDRVAIIRRMQSNGMNQSFIADVLGISRQAVNQLINRHKASARSKLNYAVSAGKIIKPDHCEECATVVSDVEAHHNDHGEPLNVIWLCIDCHSFVHKAK